MLGYRSAVKFPLWSVSAKPQSPVKALQSFTQARAPFCLQHPTHCRGSWRLVHYCKGKSNHLPCWPGYCVSLVATATASAFSVYQCWWRRSALSLSLLAQCSSGELGL